MDTDGYVEGKVCGEIVEVIRDEKAWKKLKYWYDSNDEVNIRPEEFNPKESDEDEAADGDDDANESQEAEI